MLLINCAQSWNPFKRQKEMLLGQWVKLGVGKPYYTWASCNHELENNSIPDRHRQFGQKTIN